MRPRSGYRPPSAAAVLAAPSLVLLAVACGGDDESPLSAEEQEYADAFAQRPRRRGRRLRRRRRAQATASATAIMRELGAGPFDGSRRRARRPRRRRDARRAARQGRGHRGPGRRRSPRTGTSASTSSTSSPRRSGDQFELDAEGLACFEDELAESGCSTSTSRCPFTQRRTRRRPGTPCCSGSSAWCRSAPPRPRARVAWWSSRSRRPSPPTARSTPSGPLRGPGRRRRRSGADRLLVATGSGDLSSVPPEVQEEFAAGHRHGRRRPAASRSTRSAADGARSMRRPRLRAARGAPSWRSPSGPSPGGRVGRRRRAHRG